MSDPKMIAAGRKAAATRRRNLDAKRAGKCPHCGHAPDPLAPTARRAPRRRPAVPDSTPAALRYPDRDGVFRVHYLTPGRDHRPSPGIATFSGKGVGIKCTSTAYWGDPIAQVPPAAVMSALSSLTLVAQAVGRLLWKGDPPPLDERRAPFRPARPMTSVERRAQRKRDRAFEKGAGRGFRAPNDGDRPPARPRDVTSAARNLATAIVRGGAGIAVRS